MSEQYERLAEAKLSRELMEAKQEIERLRGLMAAEDREECCEYVKAQYRAEIERLKRLNTTYVADNGRAQDQLQGEIGRSRMIVSGRI